MRRLCSLSLLLVAILLAACGGTPTAEVTGTVATPPGGKQPTPIPPPPPGEGLSDMAGRIIKRPGWYEGQNVILVGYFRGLDLLDEVILDAPEDRITDWVLADDSGAIWVTDAHKLPFPSTSHEVWRIVRVRGPVKVHANGMPYIVPFEVQWEGLKGTGDVLPALCRVAIHQSGGPDKLDRHIYWYSTGTLAVIDQGTGLRASANLKSGQNYDLDIALNRSKVFDLPSTVGAACTGCVRYDIAAVDEKAGRPHFVTVYEGSVPDQLQAFLDLAAEMSAKAKPIE